MEIGNEIEQSVFHLCHTIGKWNWETENTIPIGFLNEDIYAIYTTLQEIYNVMLELEEALYFIEFHWKFTQNLFYCDFNILSNTVDFIITNGKPHLQNLLDWDTFVSCLQLVTSYDDIAKLCTKMGLNLETTTVTLAFGIFNNTFKCTHKFVHEFIGDISVATIIFILIEMRLISNINIFKNENV